MAIDAGNTGGRDPPPPSPSILAQCESLRRDNMALQTATHAEDAQVGAAQV